MLDAVRERGVVADPIMRQRLAGIYTEHVLLDLIRMRTLSARLRGEQPGPEASIRKILADEHGQHVMEAARDLLGANGMLRSLGERSERGQHTGLGGGGGVGMRALDHPGWFDGYMFARSLTIGGGTGEVQRNIVAERALGLPHDADVLSGMTWSQTQKQNTKI
jgi:alkylation response protein AidB-like acyl-CoA dehydrogenase